jgi:hypothetical protein
MSQTIPARIVIRRDTAAAWTAANPVLLSGEWGFETDARKLKIGDGTSAWNALSYYSTGSGGSGNTILSGSGAPSSSLGVNGDIYLDSVATRLYGPKTAGTWGSGVALIGAPGAPGPPGSSAPVYAIRTDAATPGTVYVGRASVGSSEAATVWTIRRRTFSAAGVLLTTGTATGAWSNRINLTYT